MRAINLRVRAEMLDLAGALVEQRGVERADLLREALDVGLLVIAAGGPPAEQRATEVYGTLSGVRLAQRLRPCVAVLLDFLSRYAAVPLSAAPGASSAPASPPAPQNLQHAHSTIPVDHVVNDALDAFGVGRLGAAE